MTDPRISTGNLALPPALREAAIKATASYVAPQGMLLITCLAHNAEQIYAGPPWPLTQAELATFQKYGLAEISFEEYQDRNMTRRFRVEYRA